MIYDLIIIGGGPAGITAAIYAAREKLKFLIITLDIGGQVVWSSEIENYPGLHLSGIELVQKFQEHLKSYKIKIKQAEVLDLKKKGKILQVKTKKGIYESKVIIIASGKKPKRLNVPGEDKFLGKGVNYCATCHAPSFKNKIVAVVGGGNSGLDACLFLSKYARKVYLLDINPKLDGDKILRDKVLKNRKISIMNSIKTTEILGENVMNGLKYEKNGEEKILKLDGVFIEIGLIPKCDFAKIVNKNKWGEIMIFRSTKTHEENMTSISGIFAAGDVTDIPAKQIIVAAGEGAKAALVAFDYLNKFKEK